MEFMKKFWNFISHEKGETELRAFGSETKRKFVDNEGEFVNFCEKNTETRDVYAGINPRKGKGGSNEDVKEISIIPFDIDAVRPNPKTTPASEEELEIAIRKTKEIADELEELGYKRPTIDISGNGCHIFFKIPPIKLENHDLEELEERLNEFQKTFIEQFDREEIDLDPIGDPARIIRVWGTKNLKGVDKEFEKDRKNRIAKPIEINTERDEKLRDYIFNLNIDETTTDIEIEDVDLDSKTERKIKKLRKSDKILDKLLSSIDVEDYPSASEADLATASKLANEDFSPSKIAEILKKYRPREKLVERDDYLKRSIEKATKNENEVVKTVQTKTRGKIEIKLKDLKAHEKEIRGTIWYDREGKEPYFEGPIKISRRNFSQFVKFLKTYDDLEKEDCEKIEQKLAEMKSKALKAAKKSETKHSEKSQMDQIIELGISHIEAAFIDERDQPHAVFEENNEIRPIDSKKFKQFLSLKYYEETQKGVGKDILNAAANTLEAMVRKKNKKKRLHNRTARNNGAIYYDLTNEDWETIKITEEGWGISENPLLFRRVPTQKQQVKPEESDIDLDKIFDYMNISKDSDQLLYKVYLISSFIPNIPHPLIMLIGPHGSAKSDSLRFTKKIVDPTEPMLLDFPYDKDEIILQLFLQYMPIYDNLDKIKDWFSNLLCRTATGQGFIKRQLYTNEEPMIYNFRRCGGFNGVSVSPSKADLLDRLLIFKLNAIEKDNRKEENELKQEFEENRPKFLGKIFDILSKAKKKHPEIELEELPRMADWATWGEAISRAMGYENNEFLNTYLEKRGVQRREALEENPVGLAALKLMDNTEKWEGTPGELLEMLNDIADEENIDTDAEKWPGQANWVTRRLKEIETELNRESVETELDRHKDSRRWLILKKGQQTLEDSEESEESENLNEDREKAILEVVNEEEDLEREEIIDHISKQGFDKEKLEGTFKKMIDEGRIMENVGGGYSES